MCLPLEVQSERAHLQLRPAPPPRPTVTVLHSELPSLLYLLFSVSLPGEGFAWPSPNLISVFLVYCPFLSQPFGTDLLNQGSQPGPHIGHTWRL